MTHATDPTSCLNSPSTEAAAGIISDTAWRRLGEVLHLSPRELEIVNGVFEDRKEFAIAHRLGISPHTVHTHLERVYRKLQVGSRVQLIVRVFAAYMALTNDPAPAPPGVDRR